MAFCKAFFLVLLIIFIYSFIWFGQNVSKSVEWCYSAMSHFNNTDAMMGSAILTKSPADYIPF